MILSHYESNDRRLSIFFYINGLNVYCKYDTKIVDESIVFSPSIDTWYDIRIYRDGNALKIDIDGDITTLDADVTSGNGDPFNNNISGSLKIGDEGSVYPLYGYLDEFYVINYNTVIENLSLSDYVTFTDSIKNNPIKNLVQSLTLSDSRQYSVVKNLLSNLGLIDSRSSSVRKLLNNNIYFTDDFQKLGIFQLALSSALSLYDNIVKKPRKSINDDLYLADYNRFHITKNLFDSFNFIELFIASYSSISHAVLYIIDDRLGLVDKVEKTARKILSDWLDMHDGTIITILEGDHNRRLFLWSNLRLTDSIAKRIILVKNDGITLTATLGNDGYLSLQDTVSLQDKIAFRVIKLLNDTIPLTDEITQLLETEPFYFDKGVVEPLFVIEDLIVYGGAEMHFYPEQTVVAKWKTRYFVNDVLVDPDSFTIEVFDPKNVKRVNYNSAYLVKDSTGVYKYNFNIPADVVEGNWRVKIKGTIGNWVTVLNIHLEVKKQ